MLIELQEATKIYPMVKKRSALWTISLLASRKVNLYPLLDVLVRENPH